MNITTLRKKARDGSLEVEHLLHAAAERQPGLAEELARLAAAHGWQAQGLLPDGTRVVPLAKWAEVAAAYADAAFDGLRTLAQQPENTPFVLGLVEAIQTTPSVSFALEMCQRCMEDEAWFAESAFRFARTFNSLLSFKQAPAITDAQARSIQDFLLALYPHAKTESNRALALLALRGVGDRDALRFIESARAFDEPWTGTQGSVLRAIRKRLKPDASGTRL